MFHLMGSMIGRNFIEDFWNSLSPISVCCMYPCQFGRGVESDEKKQADCQRRFSVFSDLYANPSERLKNFSYRYRLSIV